LSSGVSPGNAWISEHRFAVGVRPPHVHGAVLGEYERDGVTRAAAEVAPDRDGIRELSVAPDRRDGSH